MLIYWIKYLRLIRADKKGVYVMRIGFKTYIYFRNFAHDPKRKDLSDMLMSAIFAGRCSYGDVSQTCHGEVFLSFNPLKHSPKERKRLEKEFVDYIKSC